MNVKNLGLMAIASVMAIGGAVAADGVLAPAPKETVAASAVSTPAMEILVVTAKRPDAPVGIETREETHPAVADYAMLTMTPETEPRVETVTDLPSVEALDVAPPHIELTFDDIVPGDIVALKL